MSARFPRQAEGAAAPAGVRGAGRAHARGDTRALDENAHARRVARVEITPALSAWISCSSKAACALDGRSSHLRREERRAADSLRARCSRAEPLTVSNVPHLRDVTTMLNLLGADGRRDLAWTNSSASSLSAADITSPAAPYELVKTMRASVLALGPLARALRRSARFPAGRLRDRLAAGRPAHQRPAGDGREIAHRARLHDRARSDGCSGARIRTDLVTVTGTENLMMAATLAEGTTIIENAAREPEVVDLAACLDRHGREHPGRGHSDSSRSKASSACTARSHEVMPDRIETGTFLAAAAATGGDVRLTRHARGHPRGRARQAARVRRAYRSGRGLDRAEHERRFERRQRAHCALSRVPDRHAGAVHGARTASPAGRRSSPRRSSRTASCTCRS